MSRSLKTRLFQAAREAGFLTNDPSPMRDPDDPPIGWTDGDRDGAMVYFGPDPCWLPAYEGQAPAVIPAPTDASRQDPDRCVTCGAAFGLDTRRSAAQTCAGCLVAAMDPKLKAEVVKDQARKDAKEKREMEAKGPQDFAHRKFKGKKVKDRTARS